MFNKNMDGLRQLSVCGGNVQMNVSLMTDTAGNTYSSMYAQPQSLAFGVLNAVNGFLNFSWGYAGVCLWVGKGTANESVNDITMAVDPTQPISENNPTTAFGSEVSFVQSQFTATPLLDDDGIAKIRLERIFTATEPITVSELSLSRGVQTGNTGGSNRQFMFWRKKLDTPLELSANQAFTVSLVVSPYLISTTE